MLSQKSDFRNRKSQKKAAELSSPFREKVVRPHNVACVYFARLALIYFRYATLLVIVSSPIFALAK